MNCERCSKDGASGRCITALLDYGLGNGTRREEVHFDLCGKCFALAISIQPVDLDQFLDYEPPCDVLPESHDYAFADHEREVVQQGEWY